MFLNLPEQSLEVGAKNSCVGGWRRGNQFSVFRFATSSNSSSSSSAGCGQWEDGGEPALESIFLQNLVQKMLLLCFQSFQLQDKNWLADQTSWHTNRPDKLLLTSNQVLPTSTKFCQLLPTSTKFFQFLPNLTNCCKVKVSDTATSTFVLCCLVENCLASGNLFPSKLCWWPVWWQKAC